MPAVTDRAAYERAGYVRALLTAPPGGESVLRTGETEVRSEEELEIFFPNGPWMTRIPRSFLVVGCPDSPGDDALRPWLLR
jgi:hypothetical protein